jgi:FtsP/CotA-like multicopper oxidase with cupredoxin domain
MNGKSSRRLFDRRSFLKGAGAAMVTSAGVGLMPGFLRKALLPDGVGTAAAADRPPDLLFGGTDGWISLPASPALGIYHPDDLSPDPALFTTYIFGFRNITGLSAEQQTLQKNRAQHPAPMFWVDQDADFRIQLTNLGLALRPDLFDAHTIHWHGFRNVIPFFDGEPTGSVAVTPESNFTYVFRPRHPGTYMFHCHVEDVEHVHMGMTGIVFVRPTMGPRYAYNDATTGFDREFAMFLSEVWAEAHWADSHIQLPEWSDYRADFALLNGRVYPDTLAPNGSIDPFHPVRDVDGDLIAPAGNPHLKYQPLSALVKCKEGERVLLRFANLGFKEAAMTLAGIKMRVVGKDATPMHGRPTPQHPTETDTSYEVSTVSFGAGESIDAIFTAPQHSGGSGPDKYVLYNRNYRRSNNLAAGGFGGQRTEVHVYPSGSPVPGPQTIPNG